jgi:excinuclease ABC subunit B
VQLSKELKRLEKEMYQYAEELKFEQAADIRNQIKFLRDGQFK